KLIEANRRIQESDVQGPSIYAVYRKMIQDGQSNEDVKKKMQENSIDEMDIEAFFDGINSYDEKIRALHAEVEKLKRTRSVRQKEEARAQDMLANLGNSSKLLDGRSLLHLAAEEGRVDLLRIIIEQGATVDCTDNEKRTPLMRATDNGGEECVRVFLTTTQMCGCMTSRDGEQRILHEKIIAMTLPV
ncbi:hypothetical protein PC111_g5610, partial [Phytophthora cactorum]